MVRLGIDRIDEYAQLFRGRRVGLITNPTGLASSRRSSIDILMEKCRLTALFAPEHGIRGEKQDGSEVETYVDTLTGLPVYSLYKDDRKPSLEDLSGLDVLCYDIQDVGSRYYTFIYTLANAMKVASQAGVEVVVLDRPNPVSCLSPSGSGLQKECASFIGMYDIPQNYALTIGELAELFNTEEDIGARLHVIPMEGYERGMFYEDTGLLWVSPSPNLPSVDAAVLYNGTCLFEGTNISEGRGTTHPFENIGAPYIDSRRWIEEIGRFGIDGVYLRPVSFIPQASKYRDELCNGVYVHIIDRRAFDPLKLGVAMVLSARKLFPDEFRFTAPRHEVGDYTVDLMYGSPLMRKENVSVEEVWADIDENTKRFRDSVWRRYLLYS